MDELPALTGDAPALDCSLIEASKGAREKDVKDTGTKSVGAEVMNGLGQDVDFYDGEAEEFSEHPKHYYD